MSEEEIKDILEKLYSVRPEILPPKAKKLFEAIMRIADERDESNERIEKAIELINKCVEAQLEEDYLMNRYNLMNYNCNLLDILERGDND